MSYLPPSVSGKNNDNTGSSIFFLWPHLIIHPVELDTFKGTYLIPMPYGYYQLPLSKYLKQSAKKSWKIVIQRFHVQNFLLEITQQDSVMYKI